jgi:hypothetical protein
MGAQRSSAFPQLLGQAGAGLESGLAAQEQQFGQQNLQNLMQLLGMGLQPQFETAFLPQQPSALAQFGAPIAAGLGSALPLLLQSLLTKRAQ